LKLELRCPINEAAAHAHLLAAALDLASKPAAKSSLALASRLGSVTRGINVSIDEGPGNRGQFLRTDGVNA
jgi:enoyl-CoA hydratase/carnithine racemase